MEVKIVIALQEEASAAEKREKTATDQLREILASKQSWTQTMMYSELLANYFNQMKKKLDSIDRNHESFVVFFSIIFWH